MAHWRIMSMTLFSWVLSDVIGTWRLTFRLKASCIIHYTPVLSPCGVNGTILFITGVWSTTLATTFFTNEFLRLYNTNQHILIDFSMLDFQITHLPFSTKASWQPFCSTKSFLAGTTIEFLLCIANGFMPWLGSAALAWFTVFLSYQ